MYVKVALFHYMVFKCLKQIYVYHLIKCKCFVFSCFWIISMIKKCYMIMDINIELKFFLNILWIKINMNYVNTYNYIYYTLVHI